jgi:hypothetical protein
MPPRFKDGEEVLKVLIPFMKGSLLMMCVHTPTNIKYYWSNIHVLGGGREYRVCKQILVRIT